MGSAEGEGVSGVSELDMAALSFARIPSAAFLDPIAEIIATTARPPHLSSEDPSNARGARGYLRKIGPIG
jgi:hypothetical protein